MISEFYVRLEAQKKGQFWYPGGVTAFKNRPPTNKNSVAVKLAIEIPDVYFETPELSARIVMPADAVNKPVITPEVQHNLAEELTRQLGMTVRVELPESEE